MHRSRLVALVLPVAALAVALAACGPGTPEPSESAGASVAPSAEPTPTPEGPVFSLPADCDAIASEATMTVLFTGIDQRPANDLIRPAPAVATKSLECSWFTGDTTGGDVIYYAAPADASAAHLAVVEANGFTCAEALGGTRCDKTTANAEFPVDTVETVFTRDDVWIYISMTNVASAPLLPDMVATAWA